MGITISNIYKNTNFKNKARIAIKRFNGVQPSVPNVAHFVKNNFQAVRK